jgi:hypothetical protein
MLTKNVCEKDAVSLRNSRSSYNNVLYMNVTVVSKGTSF